MFNINLTTHDIKNIMNQYFVSDVVHDLFTFKKFKTGESRPLISDTHHKIVMDNADRLNSAIIYDRDFNYNYFGFKV